MKNKKSQHKASPNKKLRINNSSASVQRQRLLADLIGFGSVNTKHARDRLNILMPAARIKELRNQGHEIFTDRISIKDLYERTHNRVARYVLIKLARGV